MSKFKDLCSLKIVPAIRKLIFSNSVCMVLMCSSEIHFYIIPMEGNRLNSIISFSPFLLKYWSRTKTPFFPPNCLLSSFWHIFDPQNFRYQCWNDNIYFSTTSRCQKWRNCKGKHTINQEISYHCTSFPGTDIGQEKEIEMLDSLKRAWKVQYRSIYHCWQAGPCGWLQEMCEYRRHLAWVESLRSAELSCNIFYSAQVGIAINEKEKERTACMCSQISVFQ